MGLLDETYSAVNGKKPRKSDKQTPSQEMNLRGLLDMATNIPGAGDALSGGMALYDAAKGDYGSAALNALGVLPFLSAGMIKGAGKAADALGGKKLTEFEQRHLTAQKNAALPVEQGGLGLPANNSAMDRARAMGAEDEIFSKAMNKSFELGKKHRLEAGGYPGAYFYGELPQNELDRVVSFGTSNNLAYEAGIRNGDMPVVTTGVRYGDAPKNGKSWNFADEHSERGVSMAKVSDPSSSGDWENTVSAMFVKPTRPERHYQGWFTDSIRGSDGEPVITNAIPQLEKGVDAVIPAMSLPNGKIRSRFAAFDPMRRHESDLLGNINPSLLGLLGVGSLGVAATATQLPEEYKSAIANAFSGKP